MPPTIDLNPPLRRKIHPWLRWLRIKFHPWYRLSLAGWQVVYRDNPRSWSQLLIALAKLDHLSLLTLLNDCLW